MTAPDSPTPDPARKAALDLLAIAPAAAFARAWESWSHKPAHRRVRGPETGLVMVRGRVGGGGQKFNLGEATVSRASVRLETGEIGHGYCLGRDHARAETIAVVDALRQRDPEAVESGILAPLREAAAHADRTRREQTAATRVDFFTLVRGED
jgi:alpha-D-ribose 1-methylphosphonate 5-triphosphate synthase subunit PhnG